MCADVVTAGKLVSGGGHGLRLLRFVSPRICTLYVCSQTQLLEYNLVMHTDESIRRRITEKVLAKAPLPVTDLTGTIRELVAIAGYAPFHRACDEVHRQSTLAGIEPWRFHILDAANCRRLIDVLPMENAGKIPAMLAAADALIMATWLPSQALAGEDPGGATPEVTKLDHVHFDANLMNLEHIAAASAAIQNLLLAATARGIRNYWSSGGVLRLPSVFRQLGIPTEQILLGAVFLFPQEIGEAELATSKLREHRTPPENWSRWVTLP